MTIRIALNHRTSYDYDHPVSLAPQLVRLRPAPHCRTAVSSYSLNVLPRAHFENWQQDPYGNFLARCVFPEKTRQFSVEVDLVADMTVINPFDFFVEPSAEEYPIEYEPWLLKELRPFLEAVPAGPKLKRWVQSVERAPRKTADFLVDLNQRLQSQIKYLVRMEPGIQPCEETLTLASGSCRDTSWLLVQILRHLGLAARFVSGYLVQLVPDVEALDGPAGTDKDFTDLHAWAEVYLPGAGWIGLDPTSGLLVGEGHIPLACTPDPASAAPISGEVEACNSEFNFSMSVTRIHEDPRVTKPYSDEQWRQIQAVGYDVDRKLNRGDVRLTMGGEPTFVSIDDMDGEEWSTAAVGPTKRKLAADLLERLTVRFAPGSLRHFGQGKWYPGESLPRWALSCIWRTDGQPIWRNERWVAKEGEDYGQTAADARAFVATLAKRLEVDGKCIAAAYEDVWGFLAAERRLPVNLEPGDSRLDDAEERARLARMVEQGVGAAVGYMLPLRRQWWQAKPRWVSGRWPVRSGAVFLMPGDSPMGLRLPLDSLPWVPPSRRIIHAVDPTVPRGPLPLRPGERAQPEIPASAKPSEPAPQKVADQNAESRGATDIIHTALCVEPRAGQLHIFMPPTERLEDYLDLVAEVEETAKLLQTPIVVEGYLPPADHRIEQIRVTPDPGVIEVNVHPAHSWEQLTRNTTALYEEARQSRLGTEKFDLDGRHTGTGGGNHVVLGGPTPSDSPFLRRPDLLRSLVGYWNNHPSLSYLFSSSFIGPTSQAPRVDEGRRDAIYELELAFAQVPAPDLAGVAQAGSDETSLAASGSAGQARTFPPWLVDRIFRHLLVDLTGNTHRAEFCIDKLYSPDSATGRLGLVELRAFEMPPHARMSLTQQLLLRGLVARFWEQPYQQKLRRWGTQLHDRFLLPHFLWQDFRDVIDETRWSGMLLEAAWFRPHFEFRFPFIGAISQRDVHIELRQAIEPWYVLGEEPAGGATARYVDSSVERLQVKVTGMTDTRHIVTCNGRPLPLHPSGTQGEFLAGVRFRAWQPPSCLHPTIPVHTPLVFDLLDTWMGRSIGGCTYHVADPAGQDCTTFPINGYEAESRRAARFFGSGHTGGPIELPDVEDNPDYPLTLDLRRQPRP